MVTFSTENRKHLNLKMCLEKTSRFNVVEIEEIDLLQIF